MNNKVVVITGASSGIGACLAPMLAEQGAKLVLLARREAALANVAADCGEDALAVVSDVTRSVEVERARDAALARFGRIDVWINNAGRGISRMPSALTEADVDEMLSVNFKSAFFGMQAVLPHFQARNEGHLINVSSMLGRVPLAPIRSAYVAAKHALNGLTATLRVELMATHPGIHVTSVHPGVVATDFGKEARHGGLDSRALPNAQPVAEVAAVIAEVIKNPRADVYTTTMGSRLVSAYYAAEDMAEMERGFGAPRRGT